MYLSISVSDDIDEKIGGISILEGSHKFGLIESEKDNWFANVNSGIQNLQKFAHAGAASKRDLA